MKKPSRRVRFVPLWLHPVAQNGLLGAVEAAQRGLIEPILVGPRNKIIAAAEQQGLDISSYELIDVVHSHAAAEKAVEMIRDTSAETLMKGDLATAELLGAVIHKTRGIRTERRLSHVFVLDVPNYHKPLFITDAAINVTPDLLVKKDILQNAIDFCQALGIKTPKVAILAAVEKVKPSIQSTIDAAALCKMAHWHLIMQFHCRRLLISISPPRYREMQIFCWRLIWSPPI